MKITLFTPHIATGRTCAGNGDYKPLQFEANQEFCADPLDGWRVRKMIYFLIFKKNNKFINLRYLAEFPRIPHSFLVA